jgi:hypothetical protein
MAALHSRRMAAKFDPNIELNPTPILWAVVLLVIAGFGTVYMIVTTGDKKPDTGAETAPK